MGNCAREFYTPPEERMTPKETELLGLICDQEDDNDRLKVAIEFARKAYNQGRKDEYDEQNPNDDSYYSLRKKKTFKQWLKK